MKKLTQEELQARRDALDIAMTGTRWKMGNQNQIEALENVKKSQDKQRSNVDRYRLMGDAIKLLQNP